uniref:Uncharacterized protein n=1 Tax=Cyprinus carpio TaxID=7962 RepID=A0A8C2FF94_CYPCA
IQIPAHAGGVRMKQVQQSPLSLAKQSELNVFFSFSLTGKRKALKLNFANPPVKPTARLPITTNYPAEMTGVWEHWKMEWNNFFFFS